MSPWHVYMVRCCDDSLYVGISNDVEARIKRHNAGKGAKYTRSRCPVVLVWCESVENASAARKREVEMKRWSRKEKLHFLASTKATSRIAEPI
ncbi:GIY-YIG nuclease family protein [Patescibacteria group bacterium]|nr:GIY-YIG nuclease family protein [Patescibacteria group bacterium]